MRAALQYVKNRPGQFHDHLALQQGLPIGSGEIESAHRHLIQKRLKIPGACWNKENAHDLLQLRTLRANQRWTLYWDSLRRKALLEVA